MHRRRNGVKKLERAREAVDLWSLLAYSGFRYPILAFRYGRGSPGAIAVPVEVKPMHPRLISARPTSAGARAHVGFATWLTTWSNDLRARPRCEHGNGYAIAPLAHATPRLKVRVSLPFAIAEKDRALPRSLLPLSSVFQAHRSPFASSICPAAPLRLDFAKPLHLRQLRGANDVAALR